MSEKAIQQSVVREAPALYRPRYPERTIFYQLVRDHFEQFALVHEERFEASDGPLRPVVRKVVDLFLDCGLLEKKGYRAEHGEVTVRPSALLPT